uniref:Type I restriction enzyme R protein N terminus (HSDR_N) n=1 Tax=Candidatus Kentrum sp. LFY TaxID=2126342 RepID=A0A450UQJ1_9GAMM|nr:MAG: Type I restriction enzyme R protein N terminus (HSDR_N) [Candidatus Kentron sp. LFY]
MKTSAKTPPTVDEILRGTAHALTIFEPEAIAGFPLFLKRGKPYLECLATGKKRPARPEEIVRQLYLKMLMEKYGYPAGRIAIEEAVQMGSYIHDKLADIVIWDKDDPRAAYIIINVQETQAFRWPGTTQELLQRQGLPHRGLDQRRRNHPPAPPRAQPLPKPPRHPPRRSNPCPSC